MNTKTMTGLWWLTAAFLSMGVNAAELETPEEVGLRVGARAPAFTLKDQNGKDVSLDSLLKRGPVALVFYRSADWCLFCKYELMHLQRNLKEFEAAGGQVVGISYDSIPKLKRFSASQTITFPLLSDPKSTTIDAYGVRDQTASDPKAGYATHATFVLDQEGVVRDKLLKVIYQEQPGVGFLVKALKDARSPERNNSTSQGIQ